jgi:hypothetical protein
MKKLGILLFALVFGFLAAPGCNKKEDDSTTNTTNIQTFPEKFEKTPGKMPGGKAPAPSLPK